MGQGMGKYVFLGIRGQLCCQAKRKNQRDSI
jgi:hypothetical protein